MGAVFVHAHFGLNQGGDRAETGRINCGKPGAFKAGRRETDHVSARFKGGALMPRSGSNESVQPIVSVGAIISGTGTSFLVTLLSAVLLGLTVSLTEWEGLSFSLDGFAYVSIAIGGMFAARRSRRMGWLHGAAVGVLYCALASLLFQDDFAVTHLLRPAWLWSAWWSCVAGAAGGILGVNL